MKISILSTYCKTHNYSQHWKCGNRFYVVNVFSDKVYHLFRSNDQAQKLSDNLLTHNMSGEKEAREFCINDNK